MARVAVVTGGTRGIGAAISKALKAAGYKVYAVIDASGDPSEMASRASVARFALGGVIPTSTNSILSETHRTWNRPEAAELAKLYGLVAPNYAAVMESYGKAQEAAMKKK